MEKFYAGDQIKVIKKKGGELTGKFVPSYKKELFIIKLDSGYNMAIKKSGIKSVKLIQKHIKKKNAKGTR